jgi:hypothetical protein
MDNMRFRVADLIKTLKKNRETHAAEYSEAKDGYRVKVIEALEKALAKAKKGAEINAYPLNELHVPSKHTDEYDRVIEMLAMTSDTDVCLTQEEFTQYVQDNWRWTSLHKSSMAIYNSVVTKKRK